MAALLPSGATLKVSPPLFYFLPGFFAGGAEQRALPPDPGKKSKAKKWVRVRGLCPQPNPGGTEKIKERMDYVIK
jgi:hypothetical protein